MSSCELSEHELGEKLFPCPRDSGAAAVHVHLLCCMSCGMCMLPNCMCLCFVTRVDRGDLVGDFGVGVHHVAH